MIAHWDGAAILRLADGKPKQRIESPLFFDAVLANQTLHFQPKICDWVVELQNSKINHIGVIKFRQKWSFHKHCIPNNL